MGCAYLKRIIIGLSPRGKAQRFDRCISLVRIQQAQFVRRGHLKPGSSKQNESVVLTVQKLHKIDFQNLPQGFVTYAETGRMKKFIDESKVIRSSQPWGDSPIRGMVERADAGAVKRLLSSNSCGFESHCHNRSSVTLAQVHGWNILASKG